MRACALALLAVGLVPTVASAQTVGGGAPVDLPWLRLFLALIVCLMLAAGAAVAMRARLSRGGPNAPGAGGGLAPGLLNLLTARGGRRLKLIETVWLGQARLSILECDGREFLVGQTAQGRLFIRPLADLDRLDLE